MYRAAKKEATETERKKDERISKLEAEVASLRKTNAEMKKAAKKAEKPTVEKRGRKQPSHTCDLQGLLPGLF